MRRDTLIGHRRHHGNQLPGVFRIVQIGANELGDVDLVLERKPLGLVFAALRDAACSLRGDVDHLVVLFDVLDVAVHIAQLPADDRQTGFDKLGGRHRYAALVIDGILVVDGDQRVEDVFGAPGHGVVHRDGHH